MSNLNTATRWHPRSVRARSRRASSLIAAMAATVLGATAAAGEAPAVTVRYDDLNLTSDAGTQILLRRLSAAAHRVCADGQQRELTRLRRAEACFREALGNAVVAVHNERLSVLYRERGRGSTT
jgi:UrcA family protein